MYVFVCTGEITQRDANLNVAMRQKKVEVRERKRCTRRENRETEGAQRQREWR